MRYLRPLRLTGPANWRRFLSVGLPNVGPALATLVLITFIWSWSNYFWPLIAMQKPSGQVAQVAMGNLVSNPNAPVYGEMFAAAAVVTAPLIILAIALQRYYTRGLMTVGAK